MVYDDWYGWYWLILVDYGWLWLMGDRSCSKPTNQLSGKGDSSRICSEQQNGNYEPFTSSSNGRATGSSRHLQLVGPWDQLKFTIDGWYLPGGGMIPTIDVGCTGSIPWDGHHDRGPATTIRRPASRRILGTLTWLENSPEEWLTPFGNDRVQAIPLSTMMNYHLMHCDALFAQISQTADGDAFCKIRNGDDWPA